MAIILRINCQSTTRCNTLTHLCHQVVQQQGTNPKDLMKMDLISSIKQTPLTLMTTITTKWIKQMVLAKCWLLIRIPIKTILLEEANLNINLNLQVILLNHKYMKQQIFILNIIIKNKKGAIWIWWLLNSSSMKKM